ncbi:MAG TPA: thiamine-phosphate kinase [Bacteroidales bacterium]|nr:thiamine-phosphate kinase [Bacteroidales bacterium]
MYSKKDKKPKLTDLSDLGEFGLIDRLTQNFPIHHPGTLKGVGDDAAVIEIKDKLLLLTTDLLIEGIHFDMTYTPLKHLGYKAAVVNFSDIAAMNGIPKQMTVSIAVSSRFSAEALDELYSGFRLACEKYKVDLVGGDTSSSVTGLMISVTVTGEADREEIVYRSGAREGNLLCVTGDLGGAYIGLLLLKREKEVFKADPDMQPELTGYEYVLGRQLKPEARTDFRNFLKGVNILPTAMIDISDGLASETLHLCKQSGLGCRLYEDKIPLDPETRRIALQFKLVPAVCALSGGEDYELLFTIGQGDYDKIKSLPGISVIGHMTAKAEGEMLVASDGKLVELTAQGWDAMRR